MGPTGQRRIGGEQILCLISRSSCRELKERFRRRRLRGRGAGGQRPDPPLGGWPGRRHLARVLPVPGADLGPGVRVREAAAADRAAQDAELDEDLGRSSGDSCSRAATPPARAARSSGSWNTSTRGTPASSRWRSRPSRELRQWYFQRYIAHLPGPGRGHAVRPVLVHPRRGRTGDGLLHPARSTPSSCARRRCSRTCWWNEGFQADQVLVLGDPRRAEHPVPDPADRPGTDPWKLSPTDLASLDKWDAYTRGQGGHVPARRSP